MIIRFYEDPESGLPHVEDHGIRVDEVEQVLQNRGVDQPGRGNAREALGQTDAGRYLRVIYVPDEDGGGTFRRHGL